MTEQEKRENVIKGLECCGYSTFTDKCQECPYDGEDCFKRLKADALALLKSQETNGGEVGMTRENAVKGLLEVADWHYGKYEQTREEDYLDDGDFLTAVANLLKAQEPRVMTLWEAVGIIDRPVYLERNVLMPDKSVNRQECWALVQATDDEHMIRIATPYGIEKWHVGAYGIGWRCWDKEPTNAQREKVKWE